ncbi:MAG: D-glycero-beta-D-manno-heptose 1-phosphate adenylyltransferase [Gemmatimonadota bacterium]|nr:D-glycero-beta-D-manno-heptose 1-phosphate adenylyltransferase [Gemmatimonadota bacterium]
MREPTSKVAASWNDAVARREQMPGKVVFTNGVFDLLHPGHVDVLTAARSRGDALIVGINTDHSVTRLKGPGRPVRNQAERAYVLAALEAVDLVVLFEQDTPLELVRALRPDVIVKGGDYTVDSIVGASEVQGWGGEVVVVPLTPGQSTSFIIEKLSAQ